MRQGSKRQWRPRRRKSQKKSVKFVEEATVLGQIRNKEKCPKRPPDGGWSWIVLLGIFVVNMTTQSLFSVSGLLLGETIRSWGHDVSAVAAASTMLVAVQNFFGLSSGILIRKWHARTLGATGAVLVFAGLICTSQATSLWMVFASWGFMAGIGMGLIVPTSFLILTHYFERYRRYAIGVAVAGTGLGQMMLPLVLHELQVQYDFSGACLIMSTIALQALPAYLLCRPIKPKPGPIPPRRDSMDSVLDLPNTSQEPVRKRRRRRRCRRCRIFWYHFYHTTGFVMLSDPVLANTIACLSLIYMTIVCFTAVLPLYLKDGGQLSPQNVAHFMTFMSCSDLVARILLPLVQEKAKLSARTVVMMSALFGSVFRSLMAEIPEYKVLLISLIFSGISRAAIVLNLNLSLAEIVPPADLMATLGVSMVCKALFTLTVGVFIGWLHDLTKSYQVYLHALTVVVILTFASWLIELIVVRRHNHHRSNASEALDEIHGKYDETEGAIITVASRQDLTAGTLRSEDDTKINESNEDTTKETRDDKDTSSGKTRILSRTTKPRGELNQTKPLKRNRDTVQSLPRRPRTETIRQVGNNAKMR